MWLSVEGNKRHESNVVGIHLELHWEQNEWFWTLARLDVILPVTGSVGWNFVLQNKNTFGAIPFNGIYSCSHVSIRPSAQLSIIGKIYLFPISLNFSPSSKVSLSAEPTQRYELMPILLSLFGSVCSRYRSVLLESTFEVSLTSAF